MGKRVTPAQVEFEISFYKGILERSPYFFEALAALGELYTLIGDYRKGLQMDLKLVKLRPEDPISLYNLACSHSLLSNVNESFEAMKKAIACGYDDAVHLSSDNDLTNLRKDSRFQELLQHCQKSSKVSY